MMVTSKDEDFPFSFMLFVILNLSICVCCWCCSFTKLYPSLWTPWTTQHTRLPCLSFTISQSLLKFMSIELVILFNHLILCRPLRLLPSIFPSIRVFSNESALHIRWPKYWSFSFYISPSNEYSGLISFRIDWFDLLSVQGKSKQLRWDQRQEILWENVHLGPWKIKAMILDPLLLLCSPLHPSYIVPVSSYMHSFP